MQQDHRIVTRQLAREQDRGGNGCDPFAASGQSEAVRGRCRDCDSSTSGSRKRILRLFAPRTQLWFVPDELDGDVPDFESGIPHPSGSFGQEGDTGCTGELRVIGTELRSKIPEPGGAEDRVAASVSHHIAVGMTSKSRFTRPVQPRQEQVIDRLERVDVGTDSDNRDSGIQEVRRHRCMPFIELN